MLEKSSAVGTGNDLECAVLDAGVVNGYNGGESGVPRQALLRPRGPVLVRIPAAAFRPRVVAPFDVEPALEQINLVTEQLADEIDQACRRRKGCNNIVSLAKVAEVRGGGTAGIHRDVLSFQEQAPVTIDQCRQKFYLFCEKPSVNQISIPAEPASRVLAIFVDWWRHWPIIKPAPLAVNAATIALPDNLMPFTGGTSIVTR